MQIRGSHLQNLCLYSQALIWQGALRSAGGSLCNGHRSHQGDAQKLQNLQGGTIVSNDLLTAKAGEYPTIMVKPPNANRIILFPCPVFTFTCILTNTHPKCF